MRSLRSGSAGNALLVQAGRSAVLVDAGGTLSRLEAALGAHGVGPGRLSAIYLTHEHADHVGAAEGLARRFGAPVVANAPTLLAAGLDPGLGLVLASGQTHCPADVEVTSFRVPHDGAEPVGYLLRAEGWTVAVATDLGCVPPGVAERLRGADLLVLEANHDVGLLRGGPYPASLKDRILSGVGHLSNEQAAAAMLGAVSGRSQWLWLAHLSAKNNRPALARGAAESALRAAGVRTVRVEVLDRHGPGPLLETPRLSRQWQLL